MNSRVAVATVMACVSALLGGTACADVTRSTTTTVRDSAGVRIVESSAPASPDAPFTLDAAPLLSIGGAAGGPQQEFSGYVLPLRLSDGRIVVANSGSHELRIFDSTGRLLTSVGRNGDGPGEFRSLAWVDVGVGDTLRTYDWDLLRVSIFSGDGVFRRSMYLGVPGSGVGLRPVGALADGRVIMRTQSHISFDSKPGVGRDTTTVLLYDADGRIADTVGQFPGTEAWIERTENTVRVSTLPFGKEFVSAVHGARVFVGLADKPEVLVVGADGQLERILRWTSTPERVTPAHIDAHIARAGEGWAAGSEARRAAYLQRQRTAPFPEFVPAYAGILVSADGTLWVEQSPALGASPPTTFDVFDADGAWRGEVAMPHRFSPTQITHDAVLGTWRDDDDVSHVQMYRLRQRR